MNLTMRSRIAAVGLVLLALSFIGSCGKSGKVLGPPIDFTSADRESVVAAVLRIPALSSPAVYPYGTVSLFNSSGFGAQDAIESWWFRREIDYADTDYVYTWSDSDGTGRPTSVVAMLCKYEKGTLRITTGTAPPDSAPGDTTVEKAIREDWFRYIRLHRTGNAWSVVGLTPVLLFADDGLLGCDTCRSTIMSVRIRADLPAGVDTTYTRPLSGMFPMLPLGGIPPFDSGQAVEITVRTTRDDDVVTLHGPGPVTRFGHTGSSTFTLTFAVSAGGLQNMIVAVQGHRSLFDDDHPNDMMCWMLPFSGPVVVPTIAGR